MLSKRNGLSSCRDLRPSSRHLLQDLPSGFSGSAVQRGSGLKAPVGPSLIRSKEERAVFHDGAADRTADLVFDAPRRRRPDLFIRVGSGIQCIVIVKPECRAVKTVGSTFRDHVHYGAGIAAEFRRELIGDEVHFLNDIGIIDRLLAAADAGIVAVLPSIMKLFERPAFR